MAQDAESYIAWDGRRYFGTPPEGWYLAVDNRWWPDPTLTEPKPAQATEQPNAANTAPEANRQSGSPHTGRPASTPPSAPPATPNQGTAPTSAPQPQRPTASRPSRRGRQRRRGRGGIGLLIFAVIYSVGALRSCTEDLSLNANDGPELPPAVEPLPDEVEIPSLPSTLDADPTPTLISGDLQLSVTGCGPAVATGMLRNLGISTTDFDLVIQVTPVNGDVEFRIERTVTGLEPDTPEPLMVQLPQAIATRNCTVVGLEATRS